MPITDTDDARRVEDHVSRIFRADRPAARVDAIRRLFVEVLDFHGAAGQVPLAGATTGVALPDTAHRVAQLDGVQVLYIALGTPETDKVRKAEAAAAAELISEQLGDDRGAYAARRERDARRRRALRGGGSSMNDFLSDIYWRWGPDGCKACGADVAYSLTRAGEGHPWVGSVTCSEDFRAFEAVEPAWSPPQGEQLPLFRVVGQRVHPLLEGAGHWHPIESQCFSSEAKECERSWRRVKGAA